LFENQAHKNHNLDSLSSHNQVSHVDSKVNLFKSGFEFHPPPRKPTLEFDFQLKFLCYYIMNLFDSLSVILIKIADIPNKSFDGGFCVHPMHFGQDKNRTFFSL